MTDDLRAACKKAVHVLTEQGEVLRAGRAVMFILERVGWGGFARFLTYPPMVWFVELGYWIVASNRIFFSKFMFTKRDG